MACLGAINYDPAAAVTKVTNAASVMAALDTTNLRITFTAPSNGAVLVRLDTIYHGSTTFPDLLLGILDGATVKARVHPQGSNVAAAATEFIFQEAVFVVPGLTGGNSYTWDAAFGNESISGAGGIKYGGPDNTTANDAFGSFTFEIWEAINLLGAVLYDPATAASKSMAAALAMTAIDTTNARITFTAPSSGKVLWRIRAAQAGSTIWGQMLLGILDGSTIRARTPPGRYRPGTSTANALSDIDASGVITGLTGGNSYTFDAAYGVETVSAANAIKYGGPNNATASDAWGALCYEIWAA